MPSEILIKSHQSAPEAKVTTPGTKAELNWALEDNGFKVIVRDKMRHKLPFNYVWTIKVSEIK